MCDHLKPQTTYSNLHVSAGGFWPGSRKVCAHQDLFQWGGNSVVQTSRCPSRLHRVLYTHWHVGCGMHFLRDGFRQATLSGIHCRGRAPSHLQGKSRQDREVKIYFKLSLYRSWEHPHQTTGQEFAVQRSCRTTSSPTTPQSPWSPGHPDLTRTGSACLIHSYTLRPDEEFLRRRPWRTPTSSHWGQELLSSETVSAFVHFINFHPIIWFPSADLPPFVLPRA